MARVGLSRDALTHAALAVIDDAGVHGFQSLTIASVAARVGVSGPSLYKHVGSLDDLRREVSLASARELIRVLGEAALGRAGDDAVVALAQQLREFAERNPGRYAAAQRAGNPDDPADAELIAVGNETVAVISGALRSYEFTPDQNIDAIRAFRAAIHGFVLLELEGGFGLPRSLDDSFDAITGMLIRGLRELAHP